MNRNILIVGGSSGIGFACAKRFVEDGDKVYNISRTDCPLEEVESLRADVTRPRELAEVFDALQEHCPKLDALIYCAGFSMAAPVEFALEEDFSYLFDVNLTGAVRAVKGALPLLKANSGRILFASSIASVFPILFDGFYSASKAGLEALAKELRMELEPYQIKVTSVRIGGTKTHFTFKRKVYPARDCKSYAREVRRASDWLKDVEQGGMAARAVAEHIFKLSKRRNPPVHSTAGIVNKSGMVLKTFLPERALLALSRRIQSKG